MLKGSLKSEFIVTDAAEKRSSSTKRERENVYVRERLFSFLPNYRSTKIFDF